MRPACKRGTERSGLLDSRLTGLRTFANLRPWCRVGRGLLAQAFFKGCLLRVVKKTRVNTPLLMPTHVAQKIPEIIIPLPGVVQMISMLAGMCADRPADAFRSQVETFPPGKRQI